MQKAGLALILGFLSGCSYFQEPLEISKAGPLLPQIFEKPELPPNFKLEANYDSIKTGFLEQKCIYCHQPGHKASRVPLLTKEDLLNSPLDIVIPGNSEESGLILVLAKEARKPMPPKNSNAPDVTEEDIAIIKQWIDKGAP